MFKTMAQVYAARERDRNEAEIEIAAELMKMSPSGSYNRDSALREAARLVRKYGASVRIKSVKEVE
jgi:indole-3-glycerol phosphate synthase